MRRGGLLWVVVSALAVGCGPRVRSTPTIVNIDLPRGPSGGSGATNPVQPPAPQTTPGGESGAPATATPTEVGPVAPETPSPEATGTAEAAPTGEPTPPASTTPEATGTPAAEATATSTAAAGGGLAPADR